MDELSLLNMIKGVSLMSITLLDYEYRPMFNDIVGFKPDPTRSFDRTEYCRSNKHLLHISYALLYRGQWSHHFRLCANVKVRVDGRADPCFPHQVNYLRHSPELYKAKEVIQE